MNLRLEKNMSKSFICDGICSVAALGRYEQNVRLPYKFIIDCILERLGQDPENMEYFESHDMFEYTLLRKNIEETIQAKNYAKAEEMLDEYESSITLRKKLHIQYICLRRGELQAIYGNHAKAVCLLKEALAYTNRLCVVEEGIGKKLLCNIELEGIYRLADSLSYGSAEDKEVFYFLFGQLKIFLEKLPDTNKRKNLYLPNIFYHLAQQQIIQQNYGRAHSFFLKAENILIAEQRMDHLSEIIELRLGIENNIVNVRREDTLERRKLITALEQARNHTNDTPFSDEELKLWKSLQRYLDPDGTPSRVLVP